MNPQLEQLLSLYNSISDDLKGKFLDIVIAEHDAKNKAAWEKANANNDVNRKI